jgi:hypothetical protein
VLTCQVGTPGPWAVRLFQCETGGSNNDYMGQPSRNPFIVTHGCDVKIEEAQALGSALVIGRSALVVILSKTDRILS